MMLSIGIPVATLLALAIASRRLTIPFGTVILLLASTVAILISGLNIPSIAASVVSLVLWGVFCYYLKDLDLDNRVLSLAIPRGATSRDGRVIGSCLPYYKGQLQYNNSLITQSETSLRAGTIITGSSGSGKTYSIIQMIRQDLDSGRPVAFFNFKGDRETLEEIESVVSSDNVDIYHLSWDDCDFSYDPLVNLDDAGRVEAILNMRKWSIDGADDHYKTGVQLFLQKTLSEFSFSGGNFLREYYTFLRTYNVPRELLDSYNTAMKLLELTISSSAGKIFSKSDREFRFGDSRQYLLLVSFTSSTKALGTSITSLMLRDLMEVGTRTPYSPDLCLYIDEFGSCESPLVVKDILEKGRSCGISTVISMQDLNQLIINTNAPFLDSVLGTVNSYIVFAGSTRQTAEKLSGTQIYEIDRLLMSLRKPYNGNPPTAIFISKYPVFLKKGGTEVYRFIPYSPRDSVLAPLIDRVRDRLTPPAPESPAEIIREVESDTLTPSVEDIPLDQVVSSDIYPDLDDYLEEIENRVREMESVGSIVKIELRDVYRFL